MPLMHWLRLFLIAFCVAFVAITGAQALKGHTMTYALTQGLLWAGISAVVFVGAAVHRWRKGQACALCDPRDEAVR
jgi:hypothetical protein